MNAYKSAMFRWATLGLLLIGFRVAAVDTLIQMTNWNIDVSAAANRPVFVTPLVYSNGVVGPIDVRKYTSDSAAKFHVSNQLSGFYKFQIQGPPATRNMYLTVPQGSGEWIPAITDWTFDPPPNFAQGYTKGQIDDLIRGSGGQATNVIDVAAGSGINVATNQPALQRTISVDTNLVVLKGISPTFNTLNLPNCTSKNPFCTR